MVVMLGGAGVVMMVVNELAELTEGDALSVAVQRPAAKGLRRRQPLREHDHGQPACQQPQQGGGGRCVMRCEGNGHSETPYARPAAVDAVRARSSIT